MRNALAVLWLAAIVVTPATAQHFHLYYVLPAEKGSKGVDVGIASADISSLGDVSDLNVLGKYSVSDNLEVGAKAVLGVMNDGRNDLSTFEVGAKCGTNEMMALTGAILLPTGDADDPGISIGAMKTKEMGDRLTGYLDVLVGTKNPLHLLGFRIDREGRGRLDALDVRDNLGIDLGPDIDITLNEKVVINAGVTIGIAGRRQTG